MAEVDGTQETFEGVSSGASATHPVQCSSLYVIRFFNLHTLKRLFSSRKNGFVLIKGFPCKIVEMTVSKTGKHGSAKVHLVGVDIFTGRKYEELCPSTHNMEVPNVERKDYPLIDITDDNYTSLLLDDGTTKDDLSLPSGELGTQIRSAFEEGKDLLVNVQTAMNQEAIISFKENNQK